MKETVRAQNNRIAGLLMIICTCMLSFISGSGDVLQTFSKPLLSWKLGVKNI